MLNSLEADDVESSRRGVCASVGDRHVCVLFLQAEVGFTLSSGVCLFAPDD